MVLSVRPMDVDKSGTVGLNMERLFRYAPCQDIAGDYRGIPAGSTLSSLRSCVSEDSSKENKEKDRGRSFESGKE